MNKDSAFRHFNFLCLCLISLLLSSCTRERIGVSNEYILLRHLASYHVNTPDPRQICPPEGQRLNVYWNLEKEFQQYNEMHLEFVIRYRNHEEEILTIPIKHPIGSYVYYILNKRYWSTGGVLAYKLDLWADGELIEEWTHLLWTEWIQLNTQLDKEQNTDKDQKDENDEKNENDQTEETQDDRKEDSSAL